VANGTLKLDLAGRTGNGGIGTFDVSIGAILNLDNTNTILGGASEFYPANFILTGDGTLSKTNIGSIDFWTGSDLTGFTGTVDVQEGALRINNIGSGGTMGSATLNIASGATFDVRYNASLAVDQLTGSGTLDQTFDGGSGLSVMVGSSDGSSTFDGVIQNSSGQPLALTKAGTGTLTLAGLNTYTGNTGIENGTLVVSASGGLRFRPTTNGITNSVATSGTGTVSFLGTVDLDLGAAATTGGNSWNLFNLSSFAGLTPAAVTTTTLGSFTEGLPGIWELTVTGAKWVFTEADGKLAYVVTATDYETWGAPYGLAAGSEAGDLDNDGLANQKEYAFGLIPDSGASVNPISVPLDKATGKFRYTRRATPTSTGLAYTVWTSENLATLTEDSGATASQSVISTAAEVETVEVTLTGTLPLAQPKLFIQVRAE
jgi:autotransporter-associated beta strand protein